MKKHNPGFMGLKIMLMLAKCGIAYENQKEALARFTLLIDARLKQGETK